VTDQGLLLVARLRKLEYLNLYRTAVTNAGLTALKRLPQLHHLFLWQTKVTPEAAHAFADQMVDQHRIQRWQQQIDELQARIKSQGIEVVEGTQSVIVPASQPGLASPATQTALVNTVCPVSGKPVDSTQTVEYLGKRIGFCCDKCLASFQKNPADYVAKLNLGS
jgi:YHS domain-containing protein